MSIRGKAKEISPLKYKAIYHYTIDDIADENEVMPIREQAMTSRIALSSIIEDDSLLAILDAVQGVRSFAVIGEVVRHTSLIINDLYRDISKLTLTERAKLSHGRR